MDNKTIVDIIKLVKKLVQCLLEQGSNKYFYQDHV